jgi:ornithine decarboxylase
VVGVSFHVGSACKNLATFTGAIETAREMFDVAEAMGHTMELLDIGGGFTGHFDCAGNVGGAGRCAHAACARAAALAPAGPRGCRPAPPPLLMPLMPPRAGDVWGHRHHH